MKRVLALFTLVATALAGVIAADPAEAGPPSPTLKVARKASGPYQPNISSVNVPTGKTKSLYFKVKNSNESTLNFNLEGTEDADVNAFYRLKWFRGAKNITEKMTAGFALQLEGGKQKEYRARIKHLPTAGNLEWCVELLASDGAPATVSSAGINGNCNL